MTSAPLPHMKLDVLQVDEPLTVHVIWIHSIAERKGMSRIGIISDEEVKMSGDNCVLAKIDGFLRRFIKIAVNAIGL